MPHPGPRTTEAAPAAGGLARLLEQSQLDFELDFLAGLLGRHAAFPDALRAHGTNLTLKGRVREGLEVDLRLIALKPNDPVAHYNLACSYALLKSPDAALSMLRRAIELGYRDFRYMREDHDLDSVRDDVRFRQLVREFENR